MMLRVYVETTVWSFAFADDSPDFRQVSLAFFDRCQRGLIEPWISSSVLMELGNADEPVRGLLKDLVSRIAPGLLPDSAAVASLAQAFLTLGAVPPSKPVDAAHVASAYVSALDAIVSWNFKHIANLRRAERFAAIAALHGYQKPLRIVTPLEVMDDAA